MAVDALARALAAGKVPVSAYEMAVKAGYTGTEEQFAEDMGNSGTNATNAANSATAAAASATTAANAAGNLAPAYSASATYAVGDHVLYDGGYYVCTTAITTAEAWTAAHWTAAKVGPEITDLKTQIDTLQNYDLGTLIPDYYINCTNGKRGYATTYSYTDFIAINGATKIIYTALYNIANVGFAFYSTNEETPEGTTPGYISGEDNAIGSIGDIKIITVPQNAKYFRFCALNAQLNSKPFYAKYGGIVGAMAKKQDNLVAGENMDETPTNNSVKPISSGGVYEALDGKVGFDAIDNVIQKVTYPQLLDSSEFLDGKELQNTALVSGPDDMDDSENWTTTNLIELTWDAVSGNRSFATNLQTGQFKALGYILRNGEWVRSASTSATTQSGDHYVFDVPEANVKLRLSVRNDLVDTSEVILTKSTEWTTDPTYGQNVAVLKDGVVKENNLSDSLKNKILPSNPCLYDGNEFQTFKNILCIGDSLTEGTFDYTENSTTKYFVDADYSYPTFLAALSGRDVVNKGYGGDTFQTWYNRYKDEDLSGFDCAIIELGLNDSTAGTSSADRLTYLGNIVTKLKNENAGIKIFISTIFKCYSNANVAAVNADIISFANNTANCYLLDVYQYGSITAGSAYVAGHLTALGYQRVAKDYYAYASKIISENPTDFKFIQYIGTNYSY